MGQRLSGKDIDVMIGGYMVHIEEATLAIEDSTTPTRTRGIPDGYIDGEVAANGEIKLATAQFQTIVDAAKRAGSFRDLGTFDLVFNGETTQEQLRLEAFDCRLRIADLMNAQASGGEKLVHTLAYDVTGRDFVRINGVPYLASRETENLG